MKARRSTSRIMLIAVVVVSMLLCQVGSALLPGISAAENEATANLSATPGVLPTFTPVIPPGQGIAEGGDLPRVLEEELLAEPFGYSMISGRPGEYLVWSTDEGGNKRYFVITHGNRYLEEIRRISDRRIRAYEDRLSENGPARMFWGGLGTVESAILSFGCGLAMLSLGSRGTGAPMADKLSNCFFGGLAFAFVSFGYSSSGVEAQAAYSLKLEWLREQMESYFVELPYTTP